MLIAYSDAHKGLWDVLQYCCWEPEITSCRFFEWKVI